MKNYRTILTVVCFIVCSQTSIVTSVWANKQNKPILELIEQHTNTSDIRDILIANSMVWLATQGGIAIHNQDTGKLLFKLTSADGLPCNSMQSLLSLDDNSLLATGDFGIALIKFANKKTKLKTKASKSKPKVISIYKNSDTFNPFFGSINVNKKGVILGFQSGLNPLIKKNTTNKHNSKYSYNYSYKQSAIKKPAMWRSVAATAGQIALGSLDGKLEIKQTDNIKKTKVFYLGKPILQLAYSNDGLLIATGGQLFVYTNSHIKPVVFKTANSAFKPIKIFATSLKQQPDGSAIIGTATGEIYHFANAKLSLIAQLNHKRITALQISKNYLWFGIANAGLHRINILNGAVSENLQASGEICSNHVTSMTRHMGVLVAGTFDEGACALINGTWQDLDNLQSNYVHGLASDGKYLWVANSNGIARYNEKFKFISIGKNDPNTLKWFSKTAAISAVKEGKSRVAISSAYGVLRIIRKGNKLTTKLYTHKNGVPRHITKIASSKGELFVASETVGVKAMGLNGNPKKYLDPNFLPEAWVMDLAPISQNELWVGTCQNGVAYILGENSIIINQKNGLPDQRIITLLATKKGAFIGTLNGLAFADKKGFVKSYVQKNMPDPRSSDLFLDANKLWYATESGLAVFKITNI